MKEDHKKTSPVNNDPLDDDPNRIPKLDNNSITTRLAYAFGAFISAFVILWFLSNFSIALIGAIAFAILGFVKSELMIHWLEELWDMLRY